MLRFLLDEKRWLVILSLLWTSCDLCREAQGQIKLSEVKTQTWVGFENPQVVNGVIVSGVNSKPTLAATTSMISVMKAVEYKYFEIEAENLQTRQFAELEEVKDGYKFKVGTEPGRYRVTARGFDPGLVTQRIEVVCEAPKPVEPQPLPEPTDLPVLTKEARRAMQNLAAGMAADMDKAADAVDSGRVKTVLELASFTVPLDVETRNTFKKSMAGPLEKSLGKDALPAGSSKALREVAAGFRSLK